MGGGGGGGGLTMYKMLTAENFRVVMSLLISP